MIQELDDWITANPGSTCILTQATFEGVPGYCCILHKVIRWQLDKKDFPLEFNRFGAPKEYPVQTICYAPSLLEAIQKALREA